MQKVGRILCLFFVIVEANAAFTWEATELLSGNVEWNQSWIAQIS